MMNTINNFTPATQLTVLANESLSNKVGVTPESIIDYNKKTSMKKNKYTNGWYKIFSLIFLFAVGAMSAMAQSTTVATGDWNTTTSGSTPWSTSGVGTLPAAGNSVTVSNAITINASVVNTIGAITIASGGKITLGASGVLNAASITIQSGGTLDMTASGTINLTGSLTNSGTYTSGAGVVNSVYFFDNFTRTATSTPTITAGGTPSVTYTGSATGTSASILLNGTAIAVAGNPSVDYVYASFPTNASSVVSPFTSTLANNTGLVTWYGTIRAAKSTTPLSSGTRISQVLAATSSNFTTGNGYVVSIIPGTTYNTIQLGYYTSGLTTSSVTSLAQIASVTGAQDFVSVKVTYNPFTKIWTLSAGNYLSHADITSGVVGTATIDPTIATMLATASSSADATYTGSAMTSFGFHQVTASSNTNIFDNYYIMTTPIVNVTASNTLTAPITPLTAMSGFSYVQSTSGPSASQSFYVNSGAISNPVTVTVSNSSNWEISKDGSTNWGSSLTFTPASSVISSSISGGNQVFVRLKASLLASNSPFTSDKLTISSVGIANQTVTLSGLVSNLSTPTSLAVANNSDTRQNITWGTVSTNILVFASTSSAAIVPSGAASSYTGANAALGSATTYSYGGNTYYLVAAGTGSNVEVTGLTSGTTYYYQVFAYSGSQYTSAATGTSTSATTGVQPVTAFSASNASGQSVLAWTNPSFNGTQSNYWDEVLVLASTGTIVAPTGNGSAYTANAAFGSSSDGNGGFVVYKGTGAGVTVTSLSDFTNYNYAVYVRHGSVWSAVTSVTAMAFPISSLTSGDFVSTGTGNYSGTTTWSTWNGTALTATTSSPGSANNVWIAGGYSVTVTNTAEPSNSALVTSTTNSSTTASANNLYVVKGTLKGIDGTLAASQKNVVIVFGTSVKVSANGVIGNTNTGGTTNGIEIFTANAGTTIIDDYPSHIAGHSGKGAIDMNKLLVYASGSTLEIATDVTLHYKGSANKGTAVALGLDNASGGVNVTTGTITIDNGATVTMDQECVLSPYTGANSNINPINFTLNVNGTLTFNTGLISGAVYDANASAAGSANGYMSLGTSIANNGSAGTGSFLHIGSTGVLNIPEFYPNGTNFVANSSIVAGGAGNGKVAGVVVDAGGQLNVGYIADLRTAGQTITGGGSFNFNTAATAGAQIKLGSSTGLGAIATTGGNNLNSTVSTYTFVAPTAWAASTVYVLGQQITSGGNIYTVTTAGTSGTTAPSGTSTFTDVVAYTYVSAAAQTTGNSSSLSSVYGLSLSNAAGITLSNALTVTNTYAQTSTVLTAAANTAVLTINSGVTQPTWSATNYIAGPVKLYSAANSLAQTLSFPVGMNSEYLPLTLNFTQGTATATAYTVVPTVGNANHNRGTLGGVSTSRYYTISAASNTITNGSITLSYSANDDDNTISLADATNLRVAQSIGGGNWTNLGGTGSANVIGSISSTTTFSALGDFAIGNLTVSNPAPTFGTASGATVGGNYTIPYTLSSYDATWQSVLLSTGSITYAGTVLTKNTDYTVTSTGITIIPNSGTHSTALRTAGTVTITVAATGYTTRTITQSVGAGTASKLAITTQPVASNSLDGVLLTTSPVVVVQDAYGNTVTTSTATITAAVATGLNFTLGGVTTAAASSGAATFTGITAINRNATDITGTITFTSGSLTPVTSSSITIKKPTTYYWVGTPGNVQNGTGWGTGATTLWNTALNGTGTTPSGINSTDIYEVNGTNIGGTTPTTGAVTLKYSNNLSIGQLRIINGAQVTMSASTSSTSTITINGDNGGKTGASTTGDVYIDGTSSLTTHSNTATGLVFMAGTSLVINTGGALTLPNGYATFNSGAIAAINGSLSTTTANVAFASGSTATINGSVTVGTAGGASTIVSVDASTLTFNSGSSCTVNVGSSTYAFGSSSTSTIGGSTYTAGIGSVVFANGSTLTLTKGADIFAGTRNVVSFGTTSSFVYNYTTSTALLIDGHSFGNITLNQTTNPSTPGANGFSCNDLNVNVSTFTLAQTGTVSITGNVTVASGATLNCSPSSSLVVNLNGTTAQTITNNGTLTLGANTTLNVNNTLGVSLGSNLTTLGGLNLTTGNLNVGSNTLTFASYAATSGSLVTTAPNLASSVNGTSIAFTGSGTFSLPASVTSLSSLSNSTGTMNVNSSFTLSGSLTNGAGTISLGSNSISVGAANTVSSNSNLTNNGIITGTGAIIMGAPSGSTSINGTGTISNLTINPATTHTTTIQTGVQSLTGVLIVTKGNLVITPTPGLILKSTSIANTAIVGNVCTGCSITGSVQVERYIPKGYRAYRDIAPQVYNAGSMYSNWQSNGSMTSGSGIFITGASATHADDGYYGANAAAAQPTPASSGLDYSINGASSASYFDNSKATSNWTTITNTTNTNLDAFQGYRVLVRGDRSFNLAKTAIDNIYGYGLRMVNPTTLKATGSLVYGTVTYNTTGVSGTINNAASTTLSTAAALNGTSTTAFSMIANPYASPVMWGTGTSTNSSTTTVWGASTGINGTYWYLDPTSSATGKYIAFNAQSGSSVSGYTSTSSVTSNGIIQPGQAFFIQNSSSASPVVIFNEAAKQTSSTKQAVFGVIAPSSKIYVGLLKKDSASISYTRVDGVAVAFSSVFTNDSYGTQDALKFGNAADNLSIEDKGKSLSIDGRLPATSADVLHLAIGKVSATEYQLAVDASNYISNGLTPYLVDSYKGTSTALTTGSNTVSFTADASVAASFANRFSLAFKPTTLAVNSIVASATLSNKIATISWNTVGEKGVSTFEVEKSTDAKSFTKIGQATAKNTASAAYATTDNSVTATTYYRIKAISQVGTVSYSNVAKVSVTNNQLPITLYPNPLKGSKVFNVAFGNIAAGNYTVSITNVLGQKVQEAAISHTGGNGSHAISINNTIAAGTYSVTIRETASGTIVSQSNLSVN